MLFYIHFALDVNSSIVCRTVRTCLLFQEVNAHLPLPALTCCCILQHHHSPFFPRVVFFFCFSSFLASSLIKMRNVSVMLACFLDVGTQFASMYQSLNVTHVSWHGGNVTRQNKIKRLKVQWIRTRRRGVRVAGQRDTLLSAWFSWPERRFLFFFSFLLWKIVMIRLDDNWRRTAQPLWFALSNVNL